MNPLTNVKNITKLNEIELASGLIHKKSWHDIYKGSAWIFIGGLEYGLTEGDILTVFSQYGEVVNLNLVRDKKTGKSKGFCFLCYANQKSTVLAVDNLNAIKLCNRTIRVDHVANYKPPKEDERDDEVTKMLKSEGCAPKSIKIEQSDVISNTKEQTKKKKMKKDKKKKKKKQKKKHGSDESDSGNQTTNVTEVKKEKLDPGYDKYDIPLNRTEDNAGKRKHQERNYEQCMNESSQSRENFRSKSDRPHRVNSERYNMQHEDKLVGKHRSKERSEHASLSRKIKRERSSSFSDENSTDHKDRHKLERTQSKCKHSDSRKKHRGVEHSSSSSSDEDSSSQSSSDEERYKTGSKNCKKDKYKNYDEKKSFHEERTNKYGYRNENSDYTSSKSRYCDMAQRDSEYSSKNRYRNDEKYANHHKDSYHRNKHDKR